jgi:hypothetical protein
VSCDVLISNMSHFLKPVRIVQAFIPWYCCLGL